MCWATSWATFSKANQGSMLWSQFWRFLPIFGENVVVFLKNLWYDSFFLQNFAVFCRYKKRHFFAKFCGENIFKIITLVPGHPFGRSVKWMSTKERTEYIWTLCTYVCMYVYSYTGCKYRQENIRYILPGLPDYYWSMIPKPEKCTKWTQNVPHGHKISQMSVKYSEWP
jgi:hypothetical protein